MRAPLFYTALAFSAGILLQWAIPSEGTVPLLGGLLCAGLLFLVRHRPRPAGVGLLILAGMLGMFRAGVDGRVPAGEIRRIVTAVPRPVTIRGVLVSDPEPGTGSSRAAFGWLEVRAIRSAENQYRVGQGGWRPLSGRIRVRFPPRAVWFGYGDELQLSGLLRAGRSPRPPLLAPRPFDEARWLWLHGAGGVLTVPAMEGMRRLAPGSGVWTAYRRAVARFRLRLEQLSRSLLGPSESAYLEALLLGNRRRINPQVQGAFQKAGTVHVLVVSGLHVGLIAFLSALMLSLLRVPRALRYFLLIGLLIGYCTLTGARPPILRATVMGVLFCLSLWRGTEFSLLNALGAATLLMAAVHPRTLADLSFQLSFAAVLGILLLGPLLLKSVPVTRNKKSVAGTSLATRNPQPTTGLLNMRRLPLWPLRAFAVSTAAWVAVAPLVAWHFRTFTPIAPLANLWAVPWASALVATGFLVLAIGMVSPAAALPFAASFSWAAQGLARGVAWMAGLPGAVWSW